MHKRRYEFLIMHRSIICHGVLSCLILKYTVHIKPNKLVCKPTLKPKHLSPSFATELIITVLMHSDVSLRTRLGKKPKAGQIAVRPSYA